MKINKIKIKLPKTDKGIINYFKNCEKRGKFIKDTPRHYKSHLKKAKHDLKRAIKEFNDECWDWTIIKAYYTIFHTGNALSLLYSIICSLRSVPIGFSLISFFAKSKS